MTEPEIEAKRLSPGDRVYVQTRAPVARSGVYLGLLALPWDASRRGVCLAYGTRGSVVDWYDPAHLQALELTIPRGVLEAIATASELRR